MCEFIVENQVMQVVTTELSAFQGKGCSIKFIIGDNDPNQAEHMELLTCSATIVNGGTMGKKFFFCKMPTDIKKGEIFSTFHVLAENFFTIVSGLLAYETELTFTVSETKLIISAGSAAKVPLELLSEENVSPELPSFLDSKIMKSLIAMVKINAQEFSSFLKKGCFLSSSAESGNEGRDHVVFTIKNDIIIGNSTNSNALSKSEKKVVSRIIPTTLALYHLKKKQQNIREDSERKDFGVKVMDAVKNKNLDALVKEYSIPTDTFSFSIPATAFSIIKKLSSGTDEVQISVTDTYFYLIYNGLTATFTLGNDVSNCYSILDSWVKSPKVSDAVVDANTLLKGLNLFLLKYADSTQPTVAHLEMKKNALTIIRGDLVIEVPYIQSDGLCELWIDPRLLNSVIKNQDRGNLCLSFREVPDANEKNPHILLEVRNGDLSDNSSDYVFILPCRAPKN